MFLLAVATHPWPRRAVGPVPVLLREEHGAKMTHLFPWSSVTYLLIAQSLS